MESVIHFNQVGNTFIKIGNSFNDFCLNVKDNVIQFWNEQELEERLIKMWAAISHFGKKSLENINKGLTVTGQALKVFSLNIKDATIKFSNWSKEKGEYVGKSITNSLKNFAEMSKVQWQEFSQNSKVFYQALKEKIAEKSAEAKEFLINFKNKTKPQIEKFYEDTKVFMSKVGKNTKNFLVKAGNNLKQFAKTSKEKLKEVYAQAKEKAPEVKDKFLNFANSTKVNLYSGAVLLGAGIASFYRKTKEKVIENVGSFKEKIEELVETTREDRAERKEFNKMVDEELEALTDNAKLKNYSVINSVIDVHETKSALSKVFKKYDYEEDIESLQDIIENKTIAKKFKKEVEIIKNSVDSVINFVKDENNSIKDRLAIQEYFEESDIYVGYGLEEIDVLTKLETAIEEFSFNDENQVGEINEETENKALINKIIESFDHLSKEEKQQLVEVLKSDNYELDQ